MKIILTRPNYNSHLITPPLGIGYLSSFLKNEGYDTKIIDGLNLEYSNDEIVEKCSGADIVGISCLSDYFLDVIKLSKKLKENGFKVVIGGPHATALPKLTLRKTKADYVIVGEGEETFLELVQGLEKNRSVEKIKGLVTPKTKKIIKRKFIKSLDRLPFPDWEQMNPKSYKKAPHGALIKNFPVAPITTTRGCPFVCKFCASPMLWQRSIRFRSPENVIKEIEHLVNDFGIKEIHFEDDNLTLKKDHIKKICNLLIKKNIKISWACPNGVRADTLTPSLLDLMKKSGCYYLAFGLESGNQNILNNINKKTTLDISKLVIKMAKKRKIMTQGFFIFGLPGETKETINETIKFAKNIPLDRAQFLLLDILPGSELWDELDYKNKVDWNKHSYQEVTWCPSTIDKKILSDAPSRAFKSFFFRPKQFFTLLKYIKLSQIPFIIKRISDFKIFSK